MTDNEDLLIGVESALANSKNALLLAKNATDHATQQQGIDMALEFIGGVLPRLQVMLFGGTITYDAARALEELKG